MHIYPKRASLLLDGLGNEIFKLVSYGATPEQWAEWLRVPLEHAAARGNLDLVNTLISAGADGSAGYRGCRGRTLLDAAALGGNADVVTALIRAKARPDVNVVSLSPLRSALYTATVCGHEEAALRLVKAGALLSYKDAVDQWSVLHEAAYGGHARLVNELLIGGADPNSAGGRHHRTPLHLAALCGCAEIIVTLLLSGANKDCVIDRDGNSLLMWAAGGGCLPVVKILLAAGADFNIRRTLNDFSALDIAATKGHVSVVKAILGQGGDVNFVDRFGFSVLHKAIKHKQVGVIDALVEAGADVERRTSFGQTPIVYAFRRDCHNLPVMIALLRGGADVNARSDGETILHRACNSKHIGVAATVDFLLRWGADETARTKNHRMQVDELPDYTGNFFAFCSLEEGELVRLLLARAPADRAWRRRCWLVMLRWRSSQAAEAASSNKDASGTRSSIAAAAESRAGSSGEVTRAGRTASRLEYWLRGTTNNGGGDVVGAGGAKTDGENLRDLVEQLLGLEPDGVFRAVVGFL